MIAALAVRMPLILATRPLGFDDGVYATSVEAMRRGAVPFRDLFSSQGPVFLPVLRGFDAAGGEKLWAPRLAMVAAAIVIGLAVLSIAGRSTTAGAAVTLGVAAAVSTSVVLAAGPLESDGLALAFATLALSLALGRGNGARHAAVVGVLLGLGLATKSLFVVPPTLAAIAVVWTRRSVRHVVVAIGSAIAIGLVVTLPFGPGLVWEQYVAFHAASPRDIEPLHNLLRLGARLVELDVATVALALVALGWATRRGTGASASASDRIAVATWLAGSATIIVLATDGAPGFGRYLAFLIVPALILVAMANVPGRIVVAVALVLIPLQLAVNATLLDGRELEPDDVDLIAALSDLPDESIVVGDAPSLTYAAGMSSPAWLADTSYARIRAGYLTPVDLLHAIAAPETCAIVMWSGRLRTLDPGLPARAARLGYDQRIEFGNDRSLMVRPACVDL